MNHIEAHIESFHRIVPVDLAVFALPFFALRRSLQSSVCKKMGGNRSMGGAGAGALFPSQAEVPRTVRECRSSLASLVSPVNSSIVSSKTFHEEPAVLLFAHTVTVTMHERC